MVRNYLQNYKFVQFNAKIQKREVLCKIQLCLNKSTSLDWDLLLDSIGFRTRNNNVQLHENSVFSHNSAYINMQPFRLNKIIGIVKILLSS